MKKVTILSSLIIISVILFSGNPGTAACDMDRPFRIEATAYAATGNPCADGSRPVAGLTVAGKKEWLGKTVLIYEDREGAVGELLMIGEVRDTGGDRRIKAGRCIDIFMNSEAEALEWGRRSVYIVLVDAEG